MAKTRFRSITLVTLTVFMLTAPVYAAQDIFNTTSASSIKELFQSLASGGQTQTDANNDTGGTDPDDAAENSGSQSPLDVFGVKGIKKGLITVDKNIFYPTDTLEVGVMIPESAAAFWDEDAQAYILIRLSDGTLMTPFLITVTGQTPDEAQTFVTLDLSESPLSEGEYQIALVLVNDGGDPAELTDWYDGFRGLIGATHFQVRSDCGEDDEDCDGLTAESDLAVDPAALTLEPYEMTIATITGGSGDYTAVSNDVAIATVNLLANYAIIAGISQGDTTITVTDTEGNTIDIAVSVTE